MPTRDDYVIRTMNANDVDTAIEWAAGEGWNPGLDDARCFRAADPDGFLAGSLDDELVATISIVRYGDSFAFLGLYIVKPAHRGRGYGMPLWTAALAHAGRRTIGLDGVVAQQDNYRKSGFALAYRNVRYQRAGGMPGTPDRRVVPLASMPFADINAYDRSVFGADRADFLACWIRQPRGTALGFVRDSVLAGYGVIRPARSGYKVGPLFGDDPEAAEAVFTALAARVPVDAAFCLDIPQANPAAVALAQRHRMAAVFETARMYAGPAPDVPLRKLFGVTTFELG